MPQEESRQVKEEAASEVAETREHPLEQHSPQPVGEGGLTTEDAWNKALEQLQEALPASDGREAETRLNETTLLQVTDTAARILVPSAYTLAWLERRMYGQICKALKGVLGKDLDLQLVTVT